MQVGEAVGLTTQAIGNIERGHNLPTLPTLIAIARILKTPIRDLIPVEPMDDDVIEVAQKVAAHLATLPPKEREWFESVLTALLRQPMKS